MAYDVPTKESLRAFEGEFLAQDESNDVFVVKLVKEHTKVTNENLV